MLLASRVFEVFGDKTVIMQTASFNHSSKALWEAQNPNGESVLTES